jgi:hypothetical protein
LLQEILLLSRGVHSSCEDKFTEDTENDGKINDKNEELI